MDSLSYSLPYTGAALLQSAPAAVFGIPAFVFWPYCLAIVLLAIGLPMILFKEVPQAKGLDKILPFGRLFYVLPLAAFAGEHFVFSKVMTGMIPSWIPGHLFWIYFVGCALVAAGLSIITKILGEWSGVLLGIMMASFVLLLHIPRVMANPRDRISWAVALRDLTFSGAAFAFAGARRNEKAGKQTSWLVDLGRFMLGIPALFFWVVQFFNTDNVAGVERVMLTPTWIPLRVVFGYLTGAVLLAAGVALILNKKARLATTYLGITVLAMMLIIYTPILVANPSDIGTAFNYFFDTLFFCGTAFVVADALPKES